MQLTKMDLVFILVLALLFVRVLRSLIAGQQVKIAAAQPGKIIADILLLAILAAAVLLRRAYVTSPLLLIGGGAAYVVLSSFVRSGFGGDGLIYNGKTIPYASMRGFRVEKETEKEVVVRILTSGRDYGVSLPPPNKEAFLARMEAAGVRSAEDPGDFDPYTGRDA